MVNQTLCGTLEEYKRLANENHDLGYFGRDNAEGRCGHCLMLDLVETVEVLVRIINAYGEDEGYTPSRVAADAERVKGLLYG